MRLTLLLALATTGALLAWTPPLAAADLGAAPVLDDPPEPARVELGTGWYLRGDIGYSRPSKPRIDFTAVPVVDAAGNLDAPVTTGLSNVRVKEGFTGGLGFGYKFNPWLRTDVTLDIGSRQSVTGTHVAGTTVCFDTCTVTTAAKTQHWTVLANGYIDLGQWSGVTPYIGAGAGISRNRLGSNVNVYYDTVTGAAIAPSDYAQSGVVSSFAWALMGGAAVNVGDHSAIDFGYRFINYGLTRTVENTTAPALKLKDNKAHEFRIGFRYMID